MNENAGTKTAREIAQALVDEIIVGARQIVATGQEHQPILFVDTRNKGRGIMPLAALGLNKDQIAQVHRSIASDAEVISAALVMECWLAQSDNKDDPAIKAVEDGKLQVSDLPEKQEALMFNIRIGEQQFLAMYVIDRATKSLAVWEGGMIDVSTKPDSEMAGRFIGDGNGTARRRMN